MGMPLWPDYCELHCQGKRISIKRSDHAKEHTAINSRHGSSRGPDPHLHDRRECSHLQLGSKPLTLQPTSGVLDYTGGTLNSFSFSYDGFANPDTVFTGTIVVLGNGHLDLDGTGPAGGHFHWYRRCADSNVVHLDAVAENYGNVHPAASTPRALFLANGFPRLSPNLAHCSS